MTLDRVRVAREELSQLVETLPGVVSFAVIDNTVSENQGYTLALLSQFESEQACRICMRHPEFVRVMKDRIEPVIEHRIVAEGSESTKVR